jgi:hypothetical protein
MQAANAAKGEHMNRRISCFATGALLALAFTPAHAGSAWIVDTDTDPASGTAANCAIGSANTCSLRDAIAAAADGDTIGFDRDMTITLGGTLTLGNDVTIDAGSFAVTIDGNQTGSVFHVNANATVTLTRLTIRNGLSNAGGGIANEGALTLSRCTVSDNRAVGGSGSNGGSGTPGSAAPQAAAAMAASAAPAITAARAAAVRAAASTTPPPAR